jgi:tetratricopeptide (TPR) repeat protein
VDAKAAFEARSEYGIIGNELLLEHVHPNIYGYALLSDAFYRAMKASGILISEDKESMSLGQLLKSMPILEMDSLAGAYKVNKLKKSWPFNQAVAGPAAATDSISQTASLQGRLAYGIVFEKVDWESAMDTLYNYYSGVKEWAKAAKVVEALALEHPTEAAFYDRAANIYGELKDDVNAAFWFRRSFSISPDFDKAHKLFVLYLKLDRPADAMPYLDYAIRNNAAGLNLAPVKRLAQEIIQLQQASKKEGPNPAILNSIAAKYLSMGLREGATHYADSVLKVDPHNKEALSLRGR